MITQCQSYKTSDGELFKTRYEAVQAEYRIELKSLIEKTVGVGGHFTIGQVSNAISANRLIFQRMKYFENQLNRCKPKNEVV